MGSQRQNPSARAALAADVACDYVIKPAYAGYAHWIPDHIQRGTMYNYVCFPDFNFHGSITVRGVEHKVKGVGGLDHVVARNVGSKSGPGVGFWHYDPIHWEMDSFLTGCTISA